WAFVLGRRHRLADLDLPVELADDVLDLGARLLLKAVTRAAVDDAVRAERHTAERDRRHELPLPVLFDEPQVADARSRVEQVFAPPIARAVDGAASHHETDADDVHPFQRAFGAERNRG